MIEDDRLPRLYDVGVSKTLDNRIAKGSKLDRSAVSDDASCKRVV